MLHYMVEHKIRIAKLPMSIATLNMLSIIISLLSTKDNTIIFLQHSLLIQLQIVLPIIEKY